MTYEVRDNEGSIFPNDRKQTEKQPDYKGSCKIDGKEYWISGWKKAGRDSGKKFLSLAFQVRIPLANEFAPPSGNTIPGNPNDADDPF